MWRGSEREENTLKGKRKGRRTLRFLLDTLFDEKKDGLIYASSGYDRTKVVVGILGVRKWTCMTLHKMEGIKKKLLVRARETKIKRKKCAHNWCMAASMLFVVFRSERRKRKERKVEEAVRA